MIFLQAIYFILPAYFANMAPVLLTKIFGKKINWPVDFGAEFQGKPLFGNHKTWRGLIGGILTGLLAAYIQKLLFAYPFFKQLSLLDYNENFLLLGILLGGGALIGDLIKSFFKRRQKIYPGKSWIPFDQLDFVIGALLFTIFIFPISVWHIVIILIISPLLHVLTNLSGYYLKINSSKL